MIKFTWKYIVLLLKFSFIALILFMMISVLGAFNDGVHQVASAIWSAIGAVGHDIWAVGVHFWHQAGSNLSGLAVGAKDDAGLYPFGFNPFRWFIGGPIEIFYAMCDAGSWWTRNGETRRAIAYIIGIPILGRILLQHIGNIGLTGGGGGGGGHSKPSGGGGGHH